MTRLKEALSGPDIPWGLEWVLIGISLRQAPMKENHKPLAQLCERHFERNLRNRMDKYLDIYRG